MAIKTALIIPDCHIPFEDVRAYDLMLNVSRSLPRIDEIVILGDYLDMYGVSRFGKDPSLGDLAELYDREIERGNDRLDELDHHFPNAKKIFIEGNHEFRLKAFMSQDGGPLRNRLSVKGELGIDDRPNWHWIDYTKHQSYRVLNSDLWARHEPFGSSHPGTQALKSGDSFIYGHTHQVAQGQFICKMSGREIIAINGGWLGEFKHKVFDYVKDRPSWSLAFTIVHVDNDKWDFQVVKIQPDYSCLYNGKRHKG